MAIRNKINVDINMDISKGDLLDLVRDNFNIDEVFSRDDIKTFVNDNFLVEDVFDKSDIEECVFREGWFKDED